jgi:hypothetical protein
MSAKKKWIHAGLKCLVMAYPPLFIGEDEGLCGYVRVMKGHPLYPKKSIGPQESRWYGYPKLQVHGGITFNEKGSKAECTYMKNGYWLGFDTKHLADYDPRWNPTGRRWTVESVAAEVEQLAEQLAARR